MKFDYEGSKDRASKLLKRFGRSITIRVLTGKTFDIPTQTNTPTYSDVTGNGVTLDFKNSEIDGSLILSSDIKLIIENLTVEPVIDSTTTIDGVAYRVSSVMLTEPAGVNIVYKIGLRK